MKNILFFNTIQNKAWKNRALFLMLALVMSVANAWGAEYKTDFKATVSKDGTGVGYVYAADNNNTPTTYYNTSDKIEESKNTGASTNSNTYYAWAKADRGSEFKGWTVTSSNNNTGINPTTSSNTNITVTVTSNIDGTNKGNAEAEFSALTPSSVTCYASEYGSYNITYSYEIATGDDANGYTFKTEEQSQLIESGNSSYSPIELYPTDVVTLKVTTNPDGFEGWFSDDSYNTPLTGDYTNTTYTYSVTEGATTAIYAKFAPSKTFYGKLTTQIASSSIGSGGKIYTSTIETANPAYTDQPSTTDATPKTPNMEATSVIQTYHLYAQPTDGRYVFIGWFNNAECTGEPLSNNLHYTYSMEVASENEENPTIQTLYACFDLIKPYYLQVNALAADPLTGMVLVSKENRTNPDYMLFEPYSSATIVASATNIPPTATAYVYAEPSYGYSFEGWYADAACKTTRLSTDNPYAYSAKAESTNAAAPTRKNLYAKFTNATTVDITYILPTNGQYTASIPTIIESNGEYVWKIEKVYNSTNETTNKTVSLYPTNHLILSATPKEGYGVQSWTDGSKTIATVLNTYQTIITSEKTIITSEKTISVTFDESKPYFLMGTNQYFSDLQIALNTAHDGSNKVVVVVKDACVPAGEYTIPSGVTLLVPYDDNYTVEKDNHVYAEAPAVSGRKVSPYRTLTLDSGVKINVDGDIVVGAQYYPSNGTNPGGVCAKYGFILMNEGSLINLNVRAKLYAWGYISGDGQIISAGSADGGSGANLYEMFQITDFRGGNATVFKYAMGDGKENKVFPILSYYMQNIEVPLTLQYGANLSVDYGLYMNSTHLTGRNYFIGSNSSAMFNMQSGTIKRWYDRMTDRIHYELNGNCDLKNISISVKYGITYTINSNEYILPINSNMTINVKSGSKFNLTQDMSFLPCTDITIEKGATMNVGEDLDVYTYDAKDWVGRRCVMPGVDFEQLLHVGRNDKGTYGKPSVRTMEADNPDHDARLKINGEMILKGDLYTSENGANICSDGGGKIIYKKSAGTKTEIWQGKNTEEFQQIPITAAKLHNNEEMNPTEPYTQTNNAVADDKFIYSQYYGKWLKNPIVITWDATTNGGVCETPQTVLPSNVPLGVLPVATKEGYTFKGWFTAESSGTQITTETIATNDVTYYAQWTRNLVGNPLDIVDADDTNLTINANGWASSGWPYKIKDKYRFKGVRAEDRTLTIHYSGTPNTDIPIVLKDKEGTVVSSHIYKVPFVYTSDETMSGTDENSIVFVKSGTLTVGTASAKEIYVAPGAELKVTGKLTVGKLVLRTKPYEAAILTIENGGAIADGGQVYYSRISPNSEQYYQFGLPLSCALAKVKMSNTGKLGGSQPKYGTAWVLKSYSESLRAQNGISKEGANWVLLENTNNTGVITAGVGYEMFSNSNYYREFYFPVNLSEATNQVSVQYTGGTIGAEHNGWNIITSPLTSRANVPTIDPATDFKVCWLNENGSYRQELPTVIPPAIPFSCQVSPKEGTLTFDANLTFAAPAPRKQSAAEALTETEWVHLDIFDAYGEGDETSLFVHPTRFEQTYKTGIDVAKQSLTAARPIIYSTHAYGDMAFAGIADSLLENGIDIAVYSPSAQELTFSLRENNFLHRLEYLWLADNETGARTDLLMDEYTCRADAGTIKGRFVLNGRFKAPQISTGIGNTQTDYNIYAIGNNIAISGVEQGTPIYVFDAVGHMIYTTSATSDEVIVPAPCAGVYMLTIGGQTAKLVVNQ